MRAGNRFQLQSRKCNQKLGEELDEYGIRRKLLPDYLERERKRETLSDSQID